MDRRCWWPLVLLAGPLPAQRAPIYPVKRAQIFPNLSYGPGAWSLLTLSNPSPFSKLARIEVYRSDGTPMQPGRVVTLPPKQSIDLRIEEPAMHAELCWARIEDISKNRGGQPIEASARLEQVNGNRLEDFARSVMPMQHAGQWISPADAVSNKSLFFLNTSRKATILEICSVNSQPSCSTEGAKPVRTPVKARQAIILEIGTLRKRALLIRSTPSVESIIGLLESETPTTREYSSESSISFDEPAEK